MVTGIRKEKVPACSEMPAPEVSVVLAELLLVSVTMVVELGLVEVVDVGSVLFSAACCNKKKRRGRVEGLKLDKLYCNKASFSVLS